MYAKFCVTRDTAQDFIRLFVNRRAFGMQAHQPLPNGKVPYYLAKDWTTKQPKPLDADIVRMHLNGDVTINLYAINPETQRCKWVAIDGDFDGAIESLFKLQWELKQDGVEAAIEGSRRGGHLWILAETPLLASECRIYIYNLALRLGVPVMGGGLKQGIEVFPKQDQIEEGEFGNAIRAPLGVHRKFAPTEWSTAADKAEFGNAFLHFIEEEWKKTLFSKKLYSRLSMTFGNIAHYNLHGFYETWFTCDKDRLAFLKHVIAWGCWGDARYTFCDVERAIKAQIRARNYVALYEMRAAEELRSIEMSILTRLEAKYRRPSAQAIAATPDATQIEADLAVPVPLSAPIQGTLF